MSHKDKMNEALTKYFRVEYSHLDIDKVTGFDERTEYGGYCETCYYEEVVCDISYVTSTGEARDFTYYGTFGNLIRNIT